MSDSNTWRRPAVARTRDTLIGVLTDHGRKPPRVLAGIIADHLDGMQLISDEALVEWVAAPLRSDPPSWEHFAPTLVDDGIATTRNRIHTAMEVLDLEPDEVRAVVIERDLIRVYRYTDRTTLAQTMPILEDP